MAYDLKLAERILKILPSTIQFAEKRMFGGIGYLVNANMACGVYGNDLIVRVGPEAYDKALESSNARPFDLTGKAMKGWLYVDPAGLQDDLEFEKWILLSLKFAGSLPPKRK